MSATPKRPIARSQHPPVAPVDTPLLVAVPDAARLLNIGTTLAWDLVRAGELPSVKLGRRVLIPRAVLERLARTDRIKEWDPDGHPDDSHHAPLSISPG